MAFTMLVRA